MAVNRVRTIGRATRAAACIAVVATTMWLGQAGAAAQTAERMYFPAVEDVLPTLLQRIRAENVRIDVGIWQLSEHAISIELVRKHQAGVLVRVLGDRVSIFEKDGFLTEMQYLASNGVPIRIRYEPTSFPYINHWKAMIFAAQNLVEFGSANYTAFELRPVSATNFKDETVLITDDVPLVNAFKTKFDQFWNDTTNFKDWPWVYQRETGQAWTTPMVIPMGRLEPDHPSPPEMGWGQGPEFNDRLISEINRELTFVDLVIYRLTVNNVTSALLNKHKAGVPVRLIVEPSEYRNGVWPEFTITGANVDKLWAAGVPIRSRTHAGITHMKTLVTSAVATNASSNIGANWQRDHNYFIPAATKPALYSALRSRFDAMWNDTSNFTTFAPLPPETPVLSAPAHNATAVPQTPTLDWNDPRWAVNYDVFLGVVGQGMSKAASKVTSSRWTPASPLQPNTTYEWRVYARTNATDRDPAIFTASTVRRFTTDAGGVGQPPPGAPASPSPADGATGVGTTPTLGWTAANATQYDVHFGTANPPPLAASNRPTTSYAPGTLAQSTTYFWQVIAKNTAGGTPGPVWRFTTNGSTTSAPEIVIYANDVGNFFGMWTKAPDSSAAAGVILTTPDLATLTDPPKASPTDYFDVTFDAPAGVRYRLWFRLRAKDANKNNDSVWAQFSDSVSSSGAPIYRTGTTNGLSVNMATCFDCIPAGWGWHNKTWWMSDTGEVWFAASGTHTLRIQVRDDGVELDQIVLSPARYVDTRPGQTTNDTTIVPKPSAPTPPGSPSSPSPADGATAPTSATLGWSATNATSYDVRLGTSNPPPQVASGITSATYNPGTLAAATTYFWQIVARNATGSTTGPLWRLTTEASPPPPGGEQPVSWTQAVNVTIAGNSLTKTGGCEGCAAGAVSVETIASGDGYMVFTAQETDKLRRIGLSHGNTDQSLNDIDFAIGLGNGTASVREFGVWKAELPYATGDVFKIEVVGGQIKYWKINGSGTRLMYTNAAPAITYPLLVDTSLLNRGATVADVKIRP
jgi:hypothetical protein